MGKKCPLGKLARRRLWDNLRNYCDDLFEQEFPLTRRFDPEQEAIDMFAELGLRHPRNTRSLRKFYNNFIPQCGHLPENDAYYKSDTTRKWKPKSTTPPSSDREVTQNQQMQKSSNSDSAEFPISTDSVSPPSGSTGSGSTEKAGGSPTPPSPDDLPSQSQINIENRVTVSNVRQSPPPSGDESGSGMIHLSSNLSLSNKWISRWFLSNCYEVPTPAALDGVHINRAPIRRDGLNILSMDYSNKHPNPMQTLKASKRMVVFGTQNDAQKYARPNKLTLANRSFCADMANKRMIFVPVPPCMVGKTLNDTPQLSAAGINTLSINMDMQRPAELCKRRFAANDTLICLFTSCVRQTEGALLLWRTRLDIQNQQNQQN